MQRQDCNRKRASRIAGSGARAAAVVLLLLALVAGCVSQGPDSIREHRGSYIDVLVTTDQEELLGNIVRLAYLDPPVFLQVNSVTTSPSLEYGAESDVLFGGAAVDPPLFTVSPSLLYRDNVTVVYKPLLGKEFSSELLMPFDIRPIFLMLDNGFDFSVVAQLLFRSLNELPNGRELGVEGRVAFRRVTDAVARMLRRGELQVGTSEEGLQKGVTHFVVQVSDGAFDTQDGRLVAEALSLDPAATSFMVRPGISASPGNLVLDPRSLLSLLSYMSGYVEAPPEHADVVWPSPALEDPGRLMRIRSSRKRPERADPAIFYRGYWFYVAQDDIRSRNILFLLRLLFNLQAQESSSGSDVQLTLPVK